MKRQHWQPEPQRRHASTNGRGHGRCAAREPSRQRPSEPQTGLRKARPDVCTRVERDEEEHQLVFCVSLEDVLHADQSDSCTRWPR